MPRAARWIDRFGRHLVAFEERWSGSRRVQHEAVDVAAIQVRLVHGVEERDDLVDVERPGADRSDLAFEHLRKMADARSDASLGEGHEVVGVVETIAPVSGSERIVEMADRGAQQTAQRLGSER